jgi:hypothetical protein
MYLPDQFQRALAAERTPAATRHGPAGQHSTADRQLGQLAAAVARRTRRGRRASRQASPWPPPARPLAAFRKADANGSC